VRSPVFDADEKGAVGRIGEGDNGLDGAVRRGEIAFELQDIPFRGFEELKELHVLASILRSHG
jgi:hypothetical protein